MFLKFRIKRLLKKYFINKDSFLLEIKKIMFNKKLYKKHINFIYMVCDYKKRKGLCTQVQLEALKRINNG